MGDIFRRLTREELIAGDADARILSIWWLIRRKARRFFATLDPSLKATTSVDDVQQEVYLYLVDANDLWQPERAEYSTFAGAVMRTCFRAIRNSCGAVRTPNSTGWTLKEYARKEVLGELSDRSAVTFRRLRVASAAKNQASAGGEDASERPIDAVSALSQGDAHGVDPLDNPAEAAALGDQVAAAKEAVDECYDHLLEYREKVVLGHYFGSWGFSRLPVAEIGLRLVDRDGNSAPLGARAVSEVKRRALAKMAEHLELEGHRCLETLPLPESA